MAQALAKGFVSAGLLDANSVGISEPNDANRAVCQESGFFTTAATQDMLGQFYDGIVVLAVKPHILPIVAAQCAQQLRNCKLIVSILAGVKIRAVAKELNLPTQAVGEQDPLAVKIIRVMPNTPAMVGRGASVFALGTNCDQIDADLMTTLFETVGTVDQVAEDQIDAVCGLSGSGPAFIYTVIDAMADGGVKMGLSRDLATKLAAQTVVGSGQMVLSTNQHPCSLKNAVCSPAGTTIAGVHALEMGGVRAAMIGAVEAAVCRAREMGQDG